MRWCSRPGGASSRRPGGGERVEANLGSQHSVLSAVVANHFRNVIKKATHDASLFRQTCTVRGAWDIRGPRLRMGTALLLRNQNGSAPASRVRMEVDQMLPFPDARPSVLMLRSYVSGGAAEQTQQPRPSLSTVPTSRRPAPD